MSYILFFDSGFGGLSVMREAVKMHPEENYIYYADNKNLPYGDKSYNEVKMLTTRAVSSVMEKYSVKAVVIACNTATSASVRHLRSIYPSVPVIGIEPAIKPACEQNIGGNVAVLATDATLKQPKFLENKALYGQKTNIYPIPCPGLVDFVEKGVFTGSELYDFLFSIYKPYKDIKFDCIVLGCTHYPFLRTAISHVFGCPNLIDGGEGTANQLFRLLDKHEACGQRIFINSADKEDFQAKALSLLNT